ncbi:DUF3558 domain-containing protein [Mycolicibacillus trivialis]
MVAKVRLFAALAALVLAMVLVAQSAPPTATDSAAVQLRSTDVPITTTIKSPIANLTDPKPFEPCDEIPFDVVAGLGLAYTPPEPETPMRCHYDAGNYQLAVEAIVWRTYAETLPADALETTINGHRAAEYWVMKPTDWNNRWWVTCMVTFKTSYGVIQQSLFYSPVYSNPQPDCLATNRERAEQLSPFYKF